MQILLEQPYLGLYYIFSYKWDWNILWNFLISIAWTTVAHTHIQLSSFNSIVKLIKNELV